MTINIDITVDEIKQLLSEQKETKQNVDTKTITISSGNNTTIMPKYQVDRYKCEKNYWENVVGRNI